MTKLEYYLACLGEECGEVQQIVGKSLRFGIYDCHPKKTWSNLKLLQQEVQDVLATYIAICEIIDADTGISAEGLEAKVNKIERNRR